MCEATSGDDCGDEGNMRKVAVEPPKYGIEGRAIEVSDTNSNGMQT